MFSKEDLFEIILVLVGRLGNDKRVDAAARRSKGRMPRLLPDLCK